MGLPTDPTADAGAPMAGLASYEVRSTAMPVALTGADGT
jgi:hypothetical protein